MAFTNFKSDSKLTPLSKMKVRAITIDLMGSSLKILPNPVVFHPFAQRKQTRKFMCIFGLFGPKYGKQMNPGPVT
ncbi:hypothetical protein I79_010944 [Cricetulus griseus]|uniref:Uncharacterized protein n=1 Tax=Cricetulus griseus TaxID=10029 RepID=G3HJU2_CRIGR|nr:hypothetical protein I79_010944 [Cricetulus griseus]